MTVEKGKRLQTDERVNDRNQKKRDCKESNPNSNVAENKTRQTDELLIKNKDKRWKN